jgi:hypothetical protein
MKIRGPAFALMFGCTALLADEKGSIDLIGLTKVQVIRRLGPPTIAHMMPTYSTGPAFEMWQYYQRTTSGELELKHVMFGDSSKTLGHCVSYAADIDPRRIVTADTWDGLRAILRYNKVHGM